MGKESHIPQTLGTNIIITFIYAHDVLHGNNLFIRSRWTIKPFRIEDTKCGIEYSV